MQYPDFSTHVDPPDLLRRFLPTPLKAMYRVGPGQILVKTNDFTLLPALPSGSHSDSHVEHTLEWKLIRDGDSLGLLESPVFLSSPALTIVVMGSACLLGLDHKRRELIGFIGAEIDARTHQEFLVPFLCQLTKEVFYAELLTEFIDRSKESVYE
jgi:hypothetical protein